MKDYMEYRHEKNDYNREREDKYKRFGKLQRSNKSLRRQQKSDKKIVLLKEINRKQTCPFLLRVFYAINAQNQFKSLSDLPLDRQIRLHTWINATLREIAELMTANLPQIRTKQRFVFWKVVMDAKKQLKKYELGVVLMHKRLDTSNTEKTLEEYLFYIGDYLDVSICYN